MPFLGIAIYLTVWQIVCKSPVWLSRCDHNNTRLDLIGGLTVWDPTVPTALAYAALAGVQPQAGLYSAKWYGKPVICSTVWTNSKFVVRN